MAKKDVVRDCETCQFQFIQDIGRGCVWCKYGIVNAYKKRDDWS